MPPTVQYVGLSHFRKISAKDFAGLGFEGQEALDLAREGQTADTNPKNLKSTAEVSDEVLAWLKKNEPGDWKELKEGEKPQQPDEDGQLRVDPEGKLPTVDETASASVEAPVATGTAKRGASGSAATPAS